MNRTLSWTLAGFFLLLLLSGRASAQTAIHSYCSPDSPRFTEEPVYSISQLSFRQNVKYVSDNRKDWRGNPVDLRYDVYAPPPADPLARRPCIMLLFGGGFFTGNRQQVANLCRQFARRGFVAVTIDYRIGKDTALPCTTATADTDLYSAEKAEYRALQDADAALRNIVDSAAAYGVDTGWLFVGGFSAGAGIANALVYTSQNEANQLFGGTNIVQQLGQINRTGSTTRFSIKGVFNNWGGIDSFFYDNADAVPMVAFHGADDDVVPLDSGRKTGSRVPQCGHNPNVYGSRGLMRLLKRQHICYDVTVKLGAGHGVFQDQDGAVYRVERAACFFKRLMCGAACSNFYQEVSRGDPDDREYADCYRPSAARAALPEGLSVYPNPAARTFRIAGLSGNCGRVALTDQTGRLLRYYEEVGARTDLSVAGLPAGVYFVRPEGAAGGDAVLRLTVIP